MMNLVDDLALILSLMVAVVTMILLAGSDRGDDAPK